MLMTDAASSTMLIHPHITCSIVHIVNETDGVNIVHETGYVDMTGTTLIRAT